MNIQNNLSTLNVPKDYVTNIDPKEEIKKIKQNSDEVVSIQATELNLGVQKDSTIKDLLDQKAMLNEKNEQLDVQAKLDLIKEKQNKDIKETKSEIESTTVTRNMISSYQEKLSEDYKVEPGSDEAQELAFRRKMYEQLHRDKVKVYTKEDLEAYNQLAEPSEYQKRMLEFDMMLYAMDDKIKENETSLESLIRSERDMELTQDDKKILKKYHEIFEEEIKIIDKQINEKIVDAAGNVVDEKI